MFSSVSFRAVSYTHLDVYKRQDKDEFLVKELGQQHYELDDNVWAIIDQNKINIYNKETTRLIKRAV